jgi:hypothetical protein
MRIFNIDNNLINNDEYIVLSDAIDYEYRSETSSESENSEEDPQIAETTEETIFNYGVYEFPIFSTPNIFASPSTDSFEEMMNPLQFI